MLGLRRRHLVPTKVILRTANMKALTVLGIIPVKVETILVRLSNCCSIS